MPAGHSETLTHYQPKWKSGKTKTIRVPIALANQLLNIAHELDEGKQVFISTSDNTDVLDDVVMAVLADSQVTRNRKDTGAVRRALVAVVELLKSQGFSPS